MDDELKIFADFVHLARLSLKGEMGDIQMFLRRTLRHYQGTNPEIAEKLTILLDEQISRNAPLRNADPVPVDLDSRLDLLRYEAYPEIDVEPIFSENIQSAFTQLLNERRHPDRLLEAGLAPSRSVLMTGPPGVGKTLAAKWLARELNIPLLTLDLSAVMSSFLGRTGTNVRYVLDYAKRQTCILFLDEFDAVAKRRDDATEIGELKRLVTVLLQEIDEWPSSGLLVAATNHPDLLDPAVWRRFDIRLEFPMPSGEQLQVAISRWLTRVSDVSPRILNLLTYALQGYSLSEAGKKLQQVQRSAVLAGENIDQHLHQILGEKFLQASRADRINSAITLVETGMSQRDVQALTGVSRDTIRKYLKS